MQLSCVKLPPWHDAWQRSEQHRRLQPPTRHLQQAALPSHSTGELVSHTTVMSCKVQAAHYARLFGPPDLSMRHSRRIFGQVTTIPTTAVALMGAGNFFLTKTVDPSAPLIMGLDPVYIYAAATLATTGLGYLCGPSLGTFLWNTLNRSRRAEVEKMDEKFWQHITRNRVDPSRQTMQNRLPDFYVSSSKGGAPLLGLKLPAATPARFPLS